MTESADPVTLRARSRVGQSLRGKWRLDQLIGVGGMAAVYSATHRNAKRGAVKMLHLELSMHADTRSRFLREGYVANTVGHPGAVSVLDDDVAEDGSVFIVMELLEGQTVDAMAESRPGKRLELAEVLGIADALLDVLAAAHDKGIVHRDLKPENLFMTRHGELKVLDFGIARLRDLAASGSKATATGAAMGTPAFMPPEQALGNWDMVDGRTDLWAVGATMYTLLSGEYVHKADTLQKMMLSSMTKPAAPIGSLLPSLPPQVCGLIDCALASEREQRWPNARAMQQAVKAARTAPAFVPAASHALAGASTTGGGLQPQPDHAHSAPAVAGVSAIDATITAPPLSRDPTLPGRSSRATVVALAVGLTAGVVVFAAVAWLALGRAGHHVWAASSAAPSASAERVAGPATSASEPAVTPPEPSAAASTPEPSATPASSAAPPTKPVPLRAVPRSPGTAAPAPPKTGPRRPRDHDI